MAVKVYLEENPTQCSFVPLAVVGYCLTQTGLLDPVWSSLRLRLQKRRHTVREKLQDVVVAIMAGCRSLHQVNTQLRPELALAQSWGRSQFAEQSTLSRTLDRLKPEHIAQLRAGHLRLLQQHTQLRHHDWRQHLIIDIDPTSLITSKRAEGSRKGWVSGKKINIAAMSSVLVWPVITKTCCQWLIPGIDTATSTVKGPCSNSSTSGLGRPRYVAKLSSAVMLNKALMPT